MTGEHVTGARVTAVPLGPRSRVALLLASAVGVLAFGWPFLVAPGSVVTESTLGPVLFAVALLLGLSVVLAEVSEGGMDAKAVALLGVLSALGAVLRPLGAGTAGVETVFFLVVLAGRVLGPGFGFVLGCTTLLASALVTGGVGPWLPYQMLGCAWVGLGAGLLPRWRRGERWLLAAYGAASALGYGFLLNLSFWPFVLGSSGPLSYLPGASVLDNLHRYLLFDAATSLGWDVGRAVTNVTLLVLAGPAVLAALRRAATRAAFDAPVEFAPDGVDDPYGDPYGDQRARRRAGGVRHRPDDRVDAQRVL